MHKSAITTALASRLVGDQFPQWADLPVTALALDGNDNTTYRLGEAMTIRLPSAEGYAPQVDKEHRWLPALAPHLPLPIPQPLAKGDPAFGYPMTWSIYRWIEGEPATIERIADLGRFATDLAEFLAALYRIDPAGGPAPGAHTFFRGGSLMTYDAETRATIAALDREVDIWAATDVWQAALAATWTRSPVWVHGDVAAGNLLVADGRLVAVIDFGCSAVGDPACDLTIAWTFLFGESREAFRDRIRLDDATWARSRGWALWKALITLGPAVKTNRQEAERIRRVIDDVIAEHKRTT
ncbi:MAG: aminoglycoside phosphotransferase family protein [Candidatus Dormibacteraeota bacterium]|nr:aminoglycoside phosphotransferase family protein [Candidatus Dormibacteraeota bacterium]